MIDFTFYGRLGADADVKIVNDKMVANFSVAVNKSFKNKNGEWQEETKWIRCSRWYAYKESKQPDYLKKGALVIIKGEPSASAFLSTDGDVIASLDCRVLKLEILSSQQSNTSNPIEPETHNGVGDLPEDDDLMF